MDNIELSAVDAFREILLERHHLRAARGMLGWSLRKLASTSQLSLSTLRRLEEDTEEASMRSRWMVVKALNEGGVRFILIDGRVVGIIMVTDVPALRPDS